jgi:hypothetical protein
MAKQQTDRQGQPIYDMRVKAPQDLIDWTTSVFGVDRESGQERTMNATVTAALRELKRIKS